MVGDNHFAFCDRDGKVKVFNTATFQLLQEINSSRNLVKSISAHSDFSMLVAGGVDKMVRIYTRDAGLFDLEQTLSFNFRVSFLELKGTRIVVAGHSG